MSEGPVFRRIPNWPNYFDETTGRPEQAAFMPRSKDDGNLSVDMDREAAERALSQPRHSRFGLCALDIAAIKMATRGEAWVALKEHRGGFQIRNCSSDWVQLALAGIARVERRPRF